MGTAAHCLEGRSTLTFYIVAGSAVIDEGYAEMIQRFYIHEKYEAKFLVHDIALMKTRRDIPENQNTKRIYLGTDIVIGGKSVYSGFGVFVPQWLLTPLVLQYISSKVIDNKSCQKQTPDKFVKNHTICTVTPRYSGACQGKLITVSMYYF